MIAHPHSKEAKMKRLLTLSVAILAILFLVFPVHSAGLYDGQVTSQWSADQTASASVVAGRCLFHGISIVTDATNDVTFTIYDSLTATGTTVLVPASQVISGTAWNKIPFMTGQTPGTLMHNGIYVAVSVAGGGSVKYKVQYSQ